MSNPLTQFNPTSATLTKPQSNAYVVARHQFVIYVMGHGHGHIANIAWPSGDRPLGADWKPEIQDD